VRKAKATKKNTDTTSESASTEYAAYIIDSTNSICYRKSKVMLYYSAL